VQQGNNVRNVIRTGGGNEINLDDTDGSQRIKLSTPHTNSCVQLGSPNAPESGVAITTETNCSSVAGASMNNITTLANGVNSIATSLGNHNINVAGKNPGFAYFEAFMAGAETVTGLASSVCNDITSSYAASYQTAQLTAANALSDYQNAEVALVEAINAIPACCLGTPMPNPDPRQQMIADLKAYDTAQTAVQTGEGQLATDKAYEKTPTGLDDTETVGGNFGTAYTAGNVALSGGQPAPGSSSDDQAALGSSSDDTDSMTSPGQAYSTDASGNPMGVDTSGNPTPYYRARYNAKLQVAGDFTALNNLLWARQTVVDPSCPGCMEALAAYDTAYAKYLINRSANEAAQEAAIKANPADPRNDNYDGNANATAAANVLGDVSTLLTDVDSTIQPLYSIYSNVLGYGINTYAVGGCTILHNEALAQQTSNVPLLWIESEGLLNTKATQGPSTPDPGDIGGRVSRVKWEKPETMTKAGFPIFTASARAAFAEARQLLGSDDFAYFWGKKLAFVGGQDNAVLSSSKQVLVTGRKQVIVHSRGTTEVAAKKDLLLSSGDNIDISTRTKRPGSTLTLAVTENKAPTDPAPMVAKPISSIKLTVNTATHVIDAPLKNGKMTLKVDDGVKVELDQASKTTKISSDTKVEVKSKEVVIDAGDAGKITLKAGGWTIEIGSSGITLKNQAGTSSLKLADGSVVAKCDPSEVNLASMSAKLKSGNGSVQVMGTGVQAGPMFNGA
jgi:type VI secretion system secreted protein VgrG